MREEQMPLMSSTSDHPQSKELEAISTIIDSTSTIWGYVLQDLNRDRIIKRRTEARGMSADQTWEIIFRDLLGFTKNKNIEKGQKVRIDCTVIESNIHKPYDSVQLFDCVRVLSRMVKKGREIKDVCFTKKRGLKETDMCRSEYVYKRLRRVRAGIEAGSSWLKRSFGLTRCTWKGFRFFKCYVLTSVVAANFQAMARKNWQ